MDKKVHDKAKEAAALAALELIKPGMIVGLGTGSTVYYLLEGLSKKIKEQGLNVRAVPSSFNTANLSRKLQIPLVDIDQISEIDITIDGADQIDPEGWLIKGGGGALLREKILAYNAKNIAIIADESKIVDDISRFPLPIEVLPFGHTWVGKALKKLGYLYDHRRDSSGTPIFTDNGHFIFDITSFPKSLKEINGELKKIPGIVETGLFSPINRKYFIGREDGTLTDRLK